METNNTKQAAWVAIGSVFSYGFTLISSMILSRYFNKVDYGTYQQVLFVYHTLLSVFTLGLPRAYSYFLPRVRNEEAKDVISKINNLFFLLGGGFSLFLFLAAPYISVYLKNPDLTGALRLFSPVPFLMLPTMGIEGVLATYKKSRMIAVYTAVTRFLMLSFVALPVILWGGGYKHAIIGFTISSLCSFCLALYLKYLPVKQYEKKRSDIRYHSVLKFSLPLLYASIWGILITSADQFFISRFFGTRVFAEFSNGAFDVPFVTMIIGVCSTVLSPVFSRLSYEKVNPREEIYPLWISVYTKSAMLVYPLLIFCWVFADVLMVLLFGQQYENSAIYFRIKIIANFFNLILFAPLLINVGKVKYYSNVHMVAAFVVIILEYLIIQICHSPYAVSIVSLLCTLGRIFVLLWAVAVYFRVKFYLLFPLKVMTKILLPSFCVLLLEHYLLCDVFRVDLKLAITAGLSVFGVFYLFYSRWVGLDYYGIVKPILVRNK